MSADSLPSWQQEALDAMSTRLREWLPDHKLHLVLIRAPFSCPLTRLEVTDPAFDELLVADPEAAQRQLLEEFEADRIAGIERDRQRAIEQQDGAKAIRSFVATKRRGCTPRKAQAHSVAQLELQAFGKA
jgi:hypothetical protein